MACLLARFSAPPLRSSLGATVGRDTADGTAVGIWVTTTGLTVGVGSAGAEVVGGETSTVAVAGAEIVGKLVAVAAVGVSSSWPSCVQDRTKSSTKTALNADSFTSNRGLKFIQITRYRWSRP